MLELTGQEIAELSDSDLRSLVALLCEEELREQGLPVSGITAGGNQTAADGGLDVRIALGGDATPQGFIPHCNTGFQVKQTDMPRSAILEEMKPKGNLRASIRELIDSNGAYIIVSGQGSTSDSALRNRREALREAVSDHPANARLHTDFYDRERMATWVRKFPGLVAWVRSKIGRPITGWRAYGNWSQAGAPVDNRFLVDDKSRIVDGSAPREGTLPLLDGIARMRETLARPRTSSRLIGMSGLGKTRLVQALFDPGVGENALPQATALYADTADEPLPSVRDMARHLIEARQRAVLIVDNCPGETHRALSEICKAPGSEVSLITVEYDIRDDDPEGTEVYRLESASEGIIENLLEQRAPHVSQNDRRRIGEFSGGNFRIALALAHTVRKGETLGNLNDSELFSRLFIQRNPDDRSLLHAAEVAALVYSFDGEDVGDGSELAILAALANIRADELYAHIAELKARGLVQSRSKWRAILPHAIANRLAVQALSRIPRMRTTEAFDGSSTRLLKSFSRRLSYLHDNEVAKDVVEQWLGEGGLLHNMANLNELGQSMLGNVAPVAPELVLEMMQRTLAGPEREAITSTANRARRRWWSLLRSFAYDATSFEQAARLLTEFVLAEPEGHNTDSASGALLELFQLYLSGTHASGDQRLALVREMIQSDIPRKQSLGFQALGTMLKSHHFSSMSDFSFGARPRDFGWQPQSRVDVQNWYSALLDLVLEAVERGGDLADHARSLLAQKFRGVWRFSGQWKRLSEASKAIASKGPWTDGWIAVRSTLKLDRDGMPSEPLAELIELEKLLRPSDLLEMARAYILSEPWSALDLGDSEDGDESDTHSDRYRRAFERAEELGSELLAEPGALALVLDEATSTKGGRANSFGRGLAAKAPDLVEMWKAIREALSKHEMGVRNYGVAVGFVSRAVELDAATIDQLLEEAIEDEVFGPVFPWLQTAVALEEKHLDRLSRAVDLGKALLHTYSYLTLGRATDPLPNDGLTSFILKLANVERGYGTAVDILHMRLHSERDRTEVMPEELVSCGQELLLMCDFNGNDRMDYELGELARWCLAGESAEATARKVCLRFKKALRDYRTSAYLFDNLALALFEKQPLVALDEMLKDDFPLSSMVGFGFARASPVGVVPEEILVEWAGQNPDERFPKLAQTITLFAKEEDDTSNSWSPLFSRLLELAPDRRAFLDVVSTRLQPSGWSGSLAAILEDRRRLVQELFVSPFAEVSDWAKEHDPKLEQWAKEERLRERREDESFE